jgi:hypothetical protein
MQMAPYSGYLKEHVGLIVAAHQRGLSLRAIAVQLYRAGARAQASDARSHLTPEAHISSLQAMAGYVLARCGLRERRRRRRRLLTASPRAKAGGIVWEA